MADLDMDRTLATVQGWAKGLHEVDQRLRPYFARSEAHQRALAHLRGLLSPTERENSWQLAEIMGDATPYGFQHLLGRADWDADAVRDALHQYVHDHLRLLCGSRARVGCRVCRPLQQELVGIISASVSIITSYNRTFAPSKRASYHPPARGQAIRTRIAVKVLDGAVEPGDATRTGGVYSTGSGRICRL